MSAVRGKRPADENFPAASWLLRKDRREPALAFYRFVRRGDDIADQPDLSPDEKLAQLAALESALRVGRPVDKDAARLAEVQRRRGVGEAQALAMLEAFRQDVVQDRYEDLGGLLAYCGKSAQPVGRFLLALHGEPSACAPAADALCSALQILNHIQDAENDRRALGRVYVPVGWMAEAGGEAAFFAPERAAARRRVLDALLDRIDALLFEATPLPETVRDRRLAIEAGATIEMAHRLARKLRAADPIVRRVAVGRADFAASLPGAVMRAFRRGGDAAVARQVVRRSGSSFALGMSILVADKRRAMNALYAFCRLVDDIADCAAPRGEKLRLLQSWRDELERPGAPIGRELAWARARFGLPGEEFANILDGMEADTAERVRIADDAALDLYCRRVAGSVGLLSVTIFGAAEARDFALSLGRTLQLVNILRDVAEDAAIDRVYVPLDRIGADASLPAAALVRLPRFEAACATLAAEAERGFAKADAMLGRLDRKALKPAILMMEGYRFALANMARQGWPRLDAGRPRLRLHERLRLLSLAAGPA